MAVFPPDARKPPGRRPALRGALVESIRQGTTVVSGWPKKRPTRSTAQIAQEEKFRAVQMAIKWMAPQIASQFAAACKGTPLMPRDLLTSMLYGRLAAFALDDGRILFPMSNYIDVSASLDAISQQIGDIIIRGAERWEGVNFDSLLAGRVKGCLMGMPSGSVSLTNTWVPAPFSVVVSDPEGWYDAATGQIQPTNIGYYIIECRVRMAAASISTGRWLRNNVVARNWGHDESVQSEAVQATTVFYFDGTAQGLEVEVFKMSGTGTVNWDNASIASYLRVIGPFI